MPIYDYVCKECGYIFDEFGKINDPPIKICPKCGKETVIRLLSKTIGLVEMGSRDYFKNVIEPEARQIAEKINNGDEDALADIIGENKM